MTTHITYWLMTMYSEDFCSNNEQKKPGSFLSKINQKLIKTLRYQIQCLCRLVVFGVRTNQTLFGDSLPQSKILSLLSRSGAAEDFLATLAQCLIINDDSKKKNTYGC